MRRAIPSRRPFLPLLAALSLAAAGCADTFVPASVIEDRRVLALVAEPPELDASVPGAAVTVRAVEAQPIDEPAPPAGTSLARRWSFCPFSTGASTGYACAVPQCERPLVPDAAGAVTVVPAAELQACLAIMGGALPPDLTGGALPALLEVLVRYRLVEVTAAAPTPREVVLREAVQRIPVWTQPRAGLNLNPAFVRAAPVTVDGVAAIPCDPADLAACTAAGTLSGAAPLTVAATIDIFSIQDYLVGDRLTPETFSLSFFTTAGRFDFERADATRTQPTGSVQLKHDQVAAGTTEALLWVVLRDLRGGQAVAGPFLLGVQP
jgi:hypothetical protein